MPLLPFAVLPVALGRGVVTAVGLGAYAYITKRWGAGRITVIVLLLSPPVLHGLLNASVDWLAALGFVLPPRMGLSFI